MDLLTVFFIGLSLSMDAFAVSIADGMTIKNLRLHHTFLTAGVFGVFQAIMPIIGFYLASTFSDAISAFDHWIAFGLLLIIGGKMIYDAIKEMHEEDPPERKFSVKKLLVEGVATSIDALAVGISFAVTKTPIFSSAGIIGITTFVCCTAGVFIGKKLGGWLKNKAAIAGGIVLIAIGIKILLEHTVFA